MSPVRRWAVQSALVCIVLLVVIACVWGTQHLLLGAAVAIGAGALLFLLRAGYQLYRVLGDMKAEMISSPFRIPPQDSHPSGS